MEEIDFETLKGVSLTKINVEGEDVIYFHCLDGTVYKMFHEQDCCELVSIKQIDGDLNDLIGSPILLAEEATKSGGEMNYETFTSTFYKLATIKGYVTISWVGYSNGYYSESVSFQKEEL